jgi:hypothetical protein
VWVPTDCQAAATAVRPQAADEIVMVSNPVASVIHLAARPVGAQSNLTPLKAKMREIDLTIAVLLTHVPPVTAPEMPFRKQTTNAPVQRQATFRRFKSCPRNQR